MHTHGPDDLAGPVRGTSAWWRGMGDRPDDSGEGTQTQVRRKGKKREGIRHELVARVRKDIAAGKYDTPEIWDETLDRLVDRLDEA